MRFGVVVPNIATPERLVEIGVLSERSGFDGFFLWDHVHRSPPVALSDTWTIGESDRRDRLRQGRCRGARTLMDHRLLRRNGEYLAIRPTGILAPDPGPGIEKPSRPSRHRTRRHSGSALNEYPTN